VDAYGAVKRALNLQSTDISAPEECNAGYYYQLEASFVLTRTQWTIENDTLKLGIIIPKDWSKPENISLSSNNLDCSTEFSSSSDDNNWLLVGWFNFTTIPANYIDTNLTIRFRVRAPSTEGLSTIRVNAWLNQMACREVSREISIVSKINNLPEVNITEPLNNTKVAGIITIRGNAKDLDGNVEYVELKVADRAWENVIGTTNWYYTLNTTEFPDGLYTIYVRAWDGLNYSEYAYINIWIENLDITPPSISKVETIPEVQLVNRWINITCEVTDHTEVNFVHATITYPDNSTQVVELEQIHATEKWYYNSTYSLEGCYQYFIYTEDVIGNSNFSINYTFMVVVNQVPEIVEFIPSLNITINETESIEFVVTVDDEDLESLSYRWYLNRQELACYTNSYMFTTDYDSEGEYNIKVIVTDRWHAYCELEWYLIVINKNRAPKLELWEELIIYETQEVSLKINAWDDDNDSLTFSANTTLFTINQTGLLSFTPNYDSAGRYYINITVSDGFTTTSQILKLVIINVNRAPTASIASPLPYTEFLTKNRIYFDATGSFDPDNETLIYRWSSNIDGNLGNDKSFYRKLSPGTHLITLEVSDGNLTSSEQITIFVESAPSKFIPGFEFIYLLLLIVWLVLSKGLLKTKSKKFKKLALFNSTIR
jgi:hypothetical protein